MANYKIGDRVEYILDDVVRDIGTVTRAVEGHTNRWWAKWDSISNEKHFSGNGRSFRKVESTKSESTTEWFENTSTTNIRPTFMFEFLMSDGTVRQGGINEVPGIDWNTNKEDDGYPHVVKYRMIGTI
jgi:hypothetical protein